MDGKIGADIGICPEGDFLKGVIDCLEDADSQDECKAEVADESAGTYSQKVIPGVGAYAQAAVGVAHVKEGAMEADARGLKAGALAKANIVGAGVGAEACVGQAFAKVGPLVGAEAKGPNAGVGVHADISRGLGAEVKLGVGEVSANVGPITATAGLNIDSGVSLGPDGFSGKLLGTGISMGGKDGFFGFFVRLKDKTVLIFFEKKDALYIIF